jgi:SAM-dependent methyltransferase
VVTVTSSDLWDAATAERYDEASAFMFAPDVLDPAVAFLAGLAGDGPVLELAIGTGRVAVPLLERGLAVSGIELSQPMVDQLRRKTTDIPVVVGDMATASVPGRFALAYCVWNSLGNLRTQAEQVACFRNAASFDTLDLATQQGTSHHYERQPDGTVTYDASNFRYAWPAECDLMAQLAGLDLERRVADWTGTPFTGDSESHVSVWRKPE